MERINDRMLADGDRFHGPTEHPQIQAKVRQHVDIVLGLGEAELNVFVKCPLRAGDGARRFLCDYLPLQTDGEVRHVVALVREVERPIDGGAALVG